MTFSVFLDCAASLAVLALLAESYGVIRRRFVGTFAAPIVLGVLFGLMAVVQMYRPFEPFDGVIIDMRNVPIALAGAFLGWRGLLPCLGIAVATRLGIGGVGMVSGVAAMAMSGLAGMIWARKMAAFPKRNFGMLLYLALAMSCHLMAAVVLPRDVALWFFTDAAGPILALNLLAVPCVGALLERENRRIAQDLRMQVALARGADGLLAGPDLVRELTAAFASQPYGTFAGLLVVRGRRDFWHLLKANTQEGCWNMVPALECLAPLLEQGHLAGRSLDGALKAFPLIHEVYPAAAKKFQHSSGEKRSQISPMACMS